MFRYILLSLFIVATCAAAATPKTFAAIGDPVYNASDAVAKLVELKTFGEHKEQMLAFVEACRTAKAQGFDLDVTRKKETSREYLDTLRELDAENKAIARIVKQKLLYVIGKDWPKTYGLFRSSGHAVISNDPELKRAVARYERHLIKSRKAAESAHKKMVKTPKNLFGKWEVNHEYDSVWEFQGHVLIVNRSDDATRQRLNGTWKIDGEHFVYTIHTITTQREGRYPHTRKNEVTRYYTLLHVDESLLKLKDIYGNILDIRRK